MIIFTAGGGSERSSIGTELGSGITAGRSTGRGGSPSDGGDDSSGRKGRCQLSSSYYILVGW